MTPFQASHLICTNETPQGCDCPIPFIAGSLLCILPDLRLLLGQPEEGRGGGAGEDYVKATSLLDPPDQSCLYLSQLNLINITSVELS